MVLRLKNFLTLFILLILSWAGWSVYNFFFDLSRPLLFIQGLDQEGHYSGDVLCILRGKDGYKVSDVTVWLDDKLLINKFKINRKEFEHSLPIPTKSLPNGKHLLKVEVNDGSYRKNKTIDERAFYIDNTPLQAAFARPDAEYKVFQGRTLHLQFQANKLIKDAQVQILSKTFEFFPESSGSSIYECFVPIACEESPNEYPFSVIINDYVGNNIKLDGKFQIMPYPFKKQVLKLDPEKVKHEKEVGIRQQEFEDKMVELIQSSPKEKLWHGEFYVPLEMTGVVAEYGVKRVTQEKGCYMHKAIDLVALPRCVVWAPADGVVVIKERYAASGNTVVIDHGWGVFSLLFHLETFADINVGDKVKRGNPVGTMGKTGYATGYHLHWEMRVNNIHVDPMQWVKRDF